MIKVLIVDDSPLMRKLLSNFLSEDKDIEIAGTAQNGKIALEKIEQLNPDIVTLDVEMPVMNGIDTLKHIMNHTPLPVIMISSYTEAGADLTFRALELGAVDFITKPDASFSRRIIDIKNDIIMKIKAAYQIKVKKIDKEELAEIEKKDIEIKEKRKIKKNIKTSPCANIVSIGISTGGPEALKKILPMFPPDINAGILIVQHMPPGFTRVFAERMNSISQIPVSEAAEGDLILPGRVLIARGDYHLSIEKGANGFYAEVNHEEKVSLFRPSIDVLMRSCAENFKEKCIGVIMTGMAHDGVEGIKLIKQNGGKTIAQDKETSVVYGMNKLAVQSGFVDKELALEQIVPAIMNILK